MSSTTIKPTVLSVRPVGAVFAGRQQIRAIVQYPGEKPAPVDFIGPVYGATMILMLLEGWREEIRVTDPGRFGDTFDVEWVRRFFA